MHAQAEEQTETRTHADWLSEPCLPCNLRRQHGPSPFRVHMVQTLKTKQTRWPPQCTVHRVRLVFSSPLTRSIYTDWSSTPHMWLGFNYSIHPCNNSVSQRKVLPPLPAPVFCFSRMDRFSLVSLKQLVWDLIPQMALLWNWVIEAILVFLFVFQTFAVDWPANW